MLAWPPDCSIHTLTPSCSPITRLYKFKHKVKSDSQSIGEVSRFSKYLGGVGPKFLIHDAALLHDHILAIYSRIMLYISGMLSTQNAVLNRADWYKVIWFKVAKSIKRLFYDLSCSVNREGATPCSTVQGEWSTSVYVWINSFVYLSKLNPAQI